MGVYATHVPSVPPFENCPLSDLPTPGPGGICKLVTPGTPRSRPDVHGKEPRGVTDQEYKPSSVTAWVVAPQAPLSPARIASGQGKIGTRTHVQQFAHAHRPVATPHPPPPAGALTERARALAHKASAARARPPRPRPPARSRKCARAALPSGRPLLSKCELPIERRGWPRAPMSPALSAAASPAPGAASAQSAAPPGRLRPAAAVPSRHRAASRAPTDERAGTRGARARAGPRLVCCLPARRRAGRTRAAQGPRCPPAPRSAPTTRAPPRLDPLPGHAPSCSRPGPPLPSPARTRDCASATPWRGDPGRSPLGRAAHPRGALPGWLPRPQADSERGAPGLSTAGAGAADPGPGAGQRPSRGR